MLRLSLCLPLSCLILSACMSGGSPDAITQSPATQPASVAQKTLPQSGQGNSGGVLADSGAAPFAGVEATMSYNAGGRSAGTRVDFHNGPMTGVGIRCTRAGGGAVVPECAGINARKVWLVNEMNGRYGYGASFAVEGFGPNGDQNAFVTLHSGPGGQTDEFVQLPGEAVGYTGAFQAGAGLTTGGQTYEGRARGSVDMLADFTAGHLSAVFNGTLTDDKTALTTLMQAGFDTAMIGPDGRFFNADGTTFSFGGRDAGGELDGAFYGPNAEEAVAAFSFGNALGGMTGVLIGCSDYTASNCVAPAPRF